MAVFIVLWPYLLTTKLRSVIRHNLGHSKRGVIINPIVNDRPSISRKEPRLGPKNAFSISSGILKGFGDVPEQ